jgi:hypothetical protein
VTDDELRDRLVRAVIAERIFRSDLREAVERAINAILPLVRDEIAAAERRGAERAAQAVDDIAPGDGWQAEVFCDLGRIAREAVPAPTGDNA